MNSAHTPLRHGVDLVDLDHLRDVMTRHAGFAERVFTERERAYAEAAPDPLPRYAARFAAKEATLKALGLGLSGTGVDRILREIEIEPTEGPPRLHLTGKAARRAAALGAQGSTVSLSHAREAALASVILWCKASSPESTA